jgi:hypothetical protein
MPHLRSSASALIAVFAAVALTGSVAFAQSDVSITLNGSPLNLNPAPQERDGRIFVPLRGVFERLGASVVYENGTITAQGNGRSVALHIGSTQATVDGQSQMLDVAPFIVGASTYVPLRFVSQALGANVNYDAANRLVALDNGQQQQRQAMQQQQQQQAMQQQSQDQQSRQAQLDQQQRAMDMQAQQQRQAALVQAQEQQRQQQAQQRSPLTIAAFHPGNDETVAARRPTVEADFARAQADPNSIRITIDGLNVTDQASRSPRGVVFSPPSDLQSGRHTVTVAGVDTNGMSFDTHWSFVSGTSTVSNTITDLRPGNDANVRNQFVVSGHTMPGARVVVQVGSVNQRTIENAIGQLLGNGSDSINVRNEVIADGSGNFETPINVQARQGQALTLVVDSTDARTQSAAPRVVRNLTIQ